MHVLGNVQVVVIAMHSTIAMLCDSVQWIALIVDCLYDFRISYDAIFVHLNVEFNLIPFMTHESAELQLIFALFV